MCDDDGSSVPVPSFKANSPAIRDANGNRVDGLMPCRLDGSVSEEVGDGFAIVGTTDGFGNRGADIDDANLGTLKWMR